MKKGYKPAIRESEELKTLVDDLNAHDENSVELLAKIDRIASSHSVTETELKRDYGFTNSSIRLLERNKLLIPISNISQRKSFNLAKALRIRIFQPGVLAAKNVRTIKKHNNIVTIYRNYFNKITDNGSITTVSLKSRAGLTKDITARKDP